MHWLPLGVAQNSLNTYAGAVLSIFRYFSFNLTNNLQKRVPVLQMEKLRHGDLCPTAVPTAQKGQRKSLIIGAFDSVSCVHSPFHKRLWGRQLSTPQLGSHSSRDYKLFVYLLISWLAGPLDLEPPEGSGPDNWGQTCCSLSYSSPREMPAPA